MVYETDNRTVDDAVRRVLDGESLDRTDGLALLAQPVDALAAGAPSSGGGSPTGRSTPAASSTRRRATARRTAASVRNRRTSTPPSTPTASSVQRRSWRPPDGPRRTALSGSIPPAAAAAERALDLAPTHRDDLWANVDRLRDGLESMGYDVRGDSHVLPVVVGDREAALALDERFKKTGVFAPAIRPPTVREGTSRVRIAPKATHTDADLNRSLAAFDAAREEVLP